MIIKLTNKDNDYSIARKIFEVEEKGEKIDCFEVDIVWFSEQKYNINVSIYGIPVKYKSNLHIK